MSEMFTEIDWVGGILFTGGTTAFLMAVSWGGVQYEWKSYQTLVPLILGPFLVAVSLIWVTRFAKNPFIRLDIYSWSSLAAFVCAMLQGFLVSR